MKLPTIWWSPITKSCRIQFLIPFCNQKWYFPFFRFCPDKVKNVKWKHSQFRGRASENLIESNFLPLFVTKNDILRFSTFALIQWSWVKNSKWNQPQFHGRGSENLIRFNFDLFLWPKTVCLVHVTFLRKTLQNLLFNVDRHKILWSDSWWKNDSYVGIENVPDGKRDLAKKSHLEFFSVFR